MVLAVVAGFLALRGPTRSESRDHPPTLSVEEVLADPAAFYSKRLRVRGRVARVLGAKAFTMGTAAGGREVLVLEVAVVPSIDDTTDRDRTPVGDLVSVEGRLRPFEMSVFEAEVGQLDRSRYTAFAGAPAMVATFVQPGPGL